MFYVFGGREWRTTPKTHPTGCVLGVLQDGNGRGDTKHVKHAQTDMFDGRGWGGNTSNRRGWVGMVFGGAGGRCVGSLA